jgi:glycosyltransferase involved in cell wall biosynthesis
VQPAQDARVAELESKLRKAIQLNEAQAQELWTAREDARAFRVQLSHLRSSHSWKVTAPLRSASNAARRLGSLGRQAAGYVFRKVPIPAIRKQELHAALATRPGLSAQAMVPGVRARTVAPVGRPAPARLDTPDVFVWAIIDWHFRIQRPQHIAREFARCGHRVFYFSGDFIDSEEAGFAVEPLTGDGCLQVVYLHVEGAPSIYFGMPDKGVEERILASLAMFLQWAEPRSVYSLVQHPFWKGFADGLPNRRLIYDLMDHHAGFSDNAPDVIQAEDDLLRSADHVLVTSTFLEGVARARNPNVTMIRNGCEYAHFAEPPPVTFRDRGGRRVVGYYGAISEWFDVELVAKIAQAYPDQLVLLIGADTVRAGERLAGYDNVILTGEVPYDSLPFYLHGFDVCIVPFQVIPLTLATNPVKVYEYLSAGKPVVSVDLPEIQQFGGLVASAPSHDSFVRRVGEQLADPGDPDRVAARRRFAAEQTWTHRVHQLRDALGSPTSR